MAAQNSCCPVSYLATSGWTGGVLRLASREEACEGLGLGFLLQVFFPPIHQKILIELISGRGSLENAENLRLDSCYWCDDKYNQRGNTNTEKYSLTQVSICGRC